MIRAALFDLDGTLIDSRVDLAGAGNAARAAVGLPPVALPEVARFVGDGAARLVERLTPDADAEARARALAAFHAHYTAHCCEATSAYAGAAEALRALRAAGWRIGVCTNKPSAYLAPILAHVGLAALVDAWRGGDRTRKPDPGQLRELMAEFGATPAATWMVGDHHTDLHAAAAAGCRALFCRWGFGQRGDAPATAQAEDLPAATRLLVADAERSDD